MEFQIYTENDKAYFLEFIDMLKLPYKTKVDNMSEKRSPNQNRYMHQIISMYAKEVGIPQYKMKGDLQKRHALIEEIVVDGKVVYEVESTATMSRTRIEEFNEAIRREAWDEHQFYLGLPNEVFTEELKLKTIT